VLLRQVQARPLQGHHLRALRRRGDAGRRFAASAWVTSTWPRGLAHLVLQGCAEPHRLPPRHRPRELEKVLYFAASIVTNVDNEARAKDLNGLEDKVKAESEQIYVDRDEQLADLEKRLAAGVRSSPRARRRASTRTTTSGPAVSPPGRRSRSSRRSRRRASSLAGSSWSSSRRSRPKTRRRSASSSATPRFATTASSPRVSSSSSASPPSRSSPRSCRSRGPREGDRRQEGRDHEAHPSHRGRLLTGEELNEEDAAIASGVDHKNLDKARGSVPAS